jgi:hypothetical protein
MQSDFRAALAFLCRSVLHPLVRILIRFGISAGELKATVDSVYAHAGAEYLKSQGERVTYSRLAVITGINRSFLPSILASRHDEFQPRSSTQLHRAARVLNGWHDDVAFQTRAGEPALLRIQGGARSFQQLARLYSGGVYYQILLSELLRVGAVRRVGNDRLRVIRRVPVAGGTNADALYSAGEVVGDLIATLEHNFSAGTRDQLPVRSLALSVDARALPLFRSQLGKRADGLMDVVDAFLHAHRPKDDSAEREGDAAHGMMLGATVFAICRTKTPTSRHQAAPASRRTPKLHR